MVVMTFIFLEYIFLDIGSHFGLKDIIFRVAHTPVSYLICVLKAMGYFRPLT